MCQASACRSTATYSVKSYSPLILKTNGEIDLFPYQSLSLMRATFPLDHLKLVNAND